ncbi:lipopolysaccharide kinase InaA family protein [Pseudomonas sp. F1_0610]|uniref:lipopolysaccharide kinase InaA family protein n=1 Tax=Pseudomonas sp. F1_0610 TaxID=3114284 RepID=UPI0039C14781
MGTRHLVGRSPQLPIQILLADGSNLELVQWLRVLPNQRYVAKANWQGSTVLAKLFIGPKAERNYQRDVSGVELLQGQAITTPMIIHQEQSLRFCCLLFEFLDPVENLADAWKRHENEAYLSSHQQDILARALQCIAHMHAQGIWQEDLHLDNLLYHHQKVYVIDGDGIQAEQAGTALSTAKATDNLGVFFAQLPIEVMPYLRPLMLYYYLVNPASAVDIDELIKVVERVRAWRLRDYLKKTKRDCTLFFAQISLFGLTIAKRAEYEQQDLAQLLENADHFINQGHIYKTGGAATVAKVIWNDKPFIIKRYNIKNWRHWLKRFWRPSRAWHSWYEGNRLNFLGIYTPALLAVKEYRWLGLRGPAWLITDYCAGQDIIAHWAQYKDISPPETELLALDQLFNALIREQISHGDLKGHNIFWQQGRWLLIDLDAVQQHQKTASFVKAYAKDRQRFLRNWAPDSALYTLLDQRLPQVHSVCHDKTKG